MKLMRHTFGMVIFSMLWIAISSCSEKSYTPLTFTGDKIHFGSGGGITGEVISYTLLENGQLFQYANKENKELARQNKKAVKAIFDKINEVDLLNKPYYKPKNFYFFVKHQSEYKTGKAVWGRKDKNLNPEIQKIYEELVALLK